MRAVLFGLLILMAQAAIAQLRNNEMGRAGLEGLRKDAKKGNPQAILELGERMDKDSIPLIKEHAAAFPPGELLTEAGKLKGATEAERHEYFVRLRRATAAKKALARMGDDSRLQEFLDGVHSSDRAMKQASIEALVYIRDKRAVKHLAPLLSEHFGLESNLHDSANDPFDRQAGEALEKILPDTAKELRKNYPKKRAHFEKEWKLWWEKHQGEYK